MRCIAVEAATGSGARLSASQCIDVETLSQRIRYNLMIGAIVPRPIAVVGTISPTGFHNLAPFSFFNGVGSEPMLLSFCPANRVDGLPKDTLRNALPPEEGGTGCFTVNIAGHRILPQVVASADELDFGMSEFAAVGLTPITGTRVIAPRVREAPIAFECVTHAVHRFAEGKPGGANIVIGRVVAVHYPEGLADSRMHIDPARLDAVGRMGADIYCTTRDRFALDRPSVTREPS